MGGFMNIRAQCSFLILALSAILLVPSVSAKQIVKWVDENGKVHFSDKPPVDKKIETEKITVKDPISNKPEKEIFKQNIEYQAREKERNEQKQKIKQEKKNAQIAKKKAQKSKGKTLSDDDKRKLCRNNYRNNVKSRTECFNKI